MKIVTVPNETLHNQAKPVGKIDRKLKKLIVEMCDTLSSQHDPEGVGLAAPQVGYSMALFIMKPKKHGPITAIINPKIIPLGSDPFKKSSSTKAKANNAKLEGCLSIPRIWGNVLRDPVVVVAYQTEDGKPVEKKFTGFEAVIIQHEIDHLNGVLFTQRVLEQKGKLYKEVDGELEKFEI